MGVILGFFYVILGFIGVTLGFIGVILRKGPLPEEPFGTEICAVNVVHVACLHYRSISKVRVSVLFRKRTVLSFALKSRFGFLLVCAWQYLNFALVYITKEHLITPKKHGAEVSAQFARQAFWSLSYA